ncbi:hypothetical protein [Kitasatospora purpeofusca]|uniref:hypothetical protein n=1 Tax=Kitasatospora purpeofusca TaxID=67352 RepID=UPI002A5983D5|nr:hypothetical protein [Kitasatospora purpeofusca]MDY0810770.1 hypothetical protein [Kitasatospora purpeofusca]
MVTTVNSLISRLQDLLLGHLTNSGVDVVAGLHDIVARASVLGPDGAWLAAAAHADLSDLAVAQGQVDLGLRHLDAAVDGGYNDCVALHVPTVRPLHQDPRFRAAYGRMRVTEADLDEFFWLHREMRIAVSDARTATVDNIGRLDTGVSLLPQAPLPTREPNTPGVLITRIHLAVIQGALQQSAVKAEFQRSSGNTALDLIDGTWDPTRARYDAWHADERDTRRQQAAQARAFVERPGASTTLAPCPPLGSIHYPA